MWKQKPCRHKLLSDKQIKFKEFCVSWKNFIKICPEIALKYFFEKNVVLYEIYSKKSKVTNTYVHGLYIRQNNVQEEKTAPSKHN
jgi:hypothetical protein